MRVIILSGISGSGKSTYVEKLREEAAKNHTSVVKCSADDFFMKSGEYKFDHTKLGEAHAECLRDFLDTLGGGGDGPSHAMVLVVDNTNTTDLEMAPYYAAAKAYGATVDLVTFLCDPKVAAARNKHGVPLASCQGMDRRLRNSIPYKGEGSKLIRQVPAFWQLASNTIIETG